MILGCVRGLAAPTAAVGRGPASTVKPMSVKAGLMPSPVTVLWHDIDPTRNFSARCLVVSGFQVLLIRNQIRDLAKT
jgi:hypothetical protein